MFSAWDFNTWVSSVGAAIAIFGVIAAVSTFLSYAAFAIWGKEAEGLAKTGLGGAASDKAPSRRAA
jgi:hypothetical protein